LAAVIRRLADDPTLCLAIAKRTRLSAVDRFDRRRLGAEVLATYRRFGIIVRTDRLR
jgi:hypothetical protein